MYKKENLCEMSKEQLIELVMGLQKDSLTGVYKREILNGIERSEYSVMMIDIDNLKQVNDNRGHLAGDIYIRSVAESIEDAIREDDILIRYGGDEFLVLLEDYDIRRINNIIRKIRNASVGFARHTDLHKAISLADRNMYKEKKRHCL